MLRVFRRSAGGYLSSCCTKASCLPFPLLVLVLALVMVLVLVLVLVRVRVLVLVLLLGRHRTRLVLFQVPLGGYALVSKTPPRRRPCSSTTAKQTEHKNKNKRKPRL